MEPLHLQGLLRLFNLVFSEREGRCGGGLPGAAGLTGRGGPTASRLAMRAASRVCMGIPPGGQMGTGGGPDTCAHLRARGEREAAGLAREERTLGGG
jgi:hypothetical protein